MTAAPAAPPTPTLRDLKAKPEWLDDDDLEVEDLPDDFGRDWRR